VGGAALELAFEEVQEIFGIRKDSFVKINNLSFGLLRQQEACLFPQPAKEKAFSVDGYMPQCH